MCRYSITKSWISHYFRKRSLCSQTLINDFHINDALYCTRSSLMAIGCVTELGVRPALWHGGFRDGNFIRVHQKFPQDPSHSWVHSYFIWLKAVRMLPLRVFMRQFLFLFDFLDRCVDWVNIYPRCINPSVMMRRCFTSSFIASTPKTHTQTHILHQHTHTHTSTFHLRAHWAHSEICGDIIMHFWSYMEPWPFEYLWNYVAAALK